MGTPTEFANRYRIHRTLGQGAMGLVWLVEDQVHKNTVALKVIAKEFGATDNAILQFKQEFRLMAQLRHPHCCAVYDYGVLPEGEPYFTMEVVPGHGLDELLPVRGEDFKHVLTQLLLALGYVHQQGLIHCDVKSANVRLTPERTVKLMDFGLMEHAGQSGGPIKGTVGYIAPEIVKRSPVDQRADLYAVGALAYELLTGQLPFDRPTPIEVLRAHLNDRPVPPSAIAPDVDPALERIVLKLLAKEPLERYQSAYEVLADLGSEVPAGIGGNLLASPMVSRDAELAVLTEALAPLTRHEPGGWVLLAGPPGVGKSRLIDEFRIRVQLDSLLCATASAPEHQPLPYSPIMGVLRSLMPALRERVPDALAQQAPVLVKLLPELAVEPAPELDAPNKEKLRMQGAIAEVLTRLAESAPLVVVLENWHCADPLSAEFLAYMRRNAAAAPILFVLTSRAVPADAPVWLEHATVLPLANLGPDGMRRMVASMLGTEEVDAGFLARLTELSEGNPFYLERLLEHLVQAKLLTNHAGRWDTAIELAPEQLPRDLRALVLRQLTALTDSAMTIAKAGAVAQRAFSLDLMKKVTRFEDDVLFDAFESLAAHQVVQPDGEGAYRFAQDQVRELLYDSLEAEERRQFHQALASALESEAAGTPLHELPLDRVTAIADHYLLAGDDAKTIHYALAAGIRHSALLGNAAAERFLAAGLALARVEGDPQVLFPYLNHLADVKRRTGPQTEALTLLTEAIAIAESTDPAPLGRLLTSLAKTQTVLGDYQNAIVLATRASDVAQAAGDHSGAARSLVTASRAQFFTGNTAEAIARGEQALALAIDGSDRGSMGAAYALLGYLYVAAMPEKLEMGVEHLDRALSLLLQEGDRIGLRNAYNLLGTAQNSLGDFQQARESHLHDRRLCFEAGLISDVLYPLLNLAITAYELGEFNQTLAYAEEAKAAMQRVESKQLLGLVLANEALASAQLGRLAHAQASMAVTAALAEDDKNKYLKSHAYLAQLELGLFLGELEAAAQAGEQLETLIRETGNTEPEGRMHALMAELRARQNRLPDAKHHLERALEIATRTHAKGIRAMALTAKAWIALREQDWDAAMEHGGSALTLARQIEARRLQAEALGILGETALATGQDDAESRFTEMAALADAMQAPHLKALALFGQAAAKPYATTASELVRQAQQLLHTTADDLPPQARPAFHSSFERSRVLEGNFIEFGFRKVEAARPAQAMMPGMGFGGLW